MPTNKKFHIFVVDDDEFQRQLLVDILVRNENYHISSFENGEDCIKNLNENPDVVVLDHLMDFGGIVNRMNGDEALEKIIKEKPHTQVIIFTQQDDPMKTFEFVEHEACAYIQKNKMEGIREVEYKVNEIFAHKKQANITLS